MQADLYDKFVYSVKQQPFARKTGYYCYLNKYWHDLQSCYVASKQSKRTENLGLMKTLILLRLLWRFM